jgi:hypothetical protein
LSTYNTDNLHVDIDLETARVLHRIVRAMHDGECPKCHWLFESSLMRGKRTIDSSALITGIPESVPVLMNLVCPCCGFTITDEEAKAALETFAPAMERGLEVFEHWRESRQNKADATK